MRSSTLPRDGLRQRPNIAGMWPLTWLWTRSTRGSQATCLPNWTLLECDAGEGWYTSSNTKRSFVMPSKLERTAPRHTEDEEEVSMVSGGTLLADGLSLRKLWENEHDELQWHFGIGTKTCWTGPAHLDPQVVFHPTLKSGGKRSGVVVIDHIGITSVILTECSLRIKYWYQKYTNHGSK